LSDSLVIIPTYNEKENIEAISRAVFALPHPFHILVVDDNSKDGTAAIVKQLMKEFPDRLFLEERSGKLGLGTAYIMASAGHCRKAMLLFMKWMPISHITQPI
jgi:dolichol-phosphate mannosyltransferase